MRILLMILAFILGMFTESYLRAFFTDDCPRHYMGYKCRGDECDHTPEAWRGIKRF